MTKILLRNESLQATFNQKGAELISLTDADGREYIWEGNPEVWGKHAPVLFPIVGTLKNNSYVYQGSRYTMGRHGFARDRVFSVEMQSDDEVVFLLEDDEETRAVYPFRFEFRIRYLLATSQLRVTFEVRNAGDGPLWFSVGGHPAFALPKPFESYAVAISDPGMMGYRLLENDLLSAETRTLHATSGSFALDYKLFENDALVFTSHSCKSMTIIEEGRELLTVSFPDFPHLGLWTKPGASFLCIEPWQGYADTTTASGKLEEKEGIIQLGTGNEYHASFSIQIHS